MQTSGLPKTVARSMCDIFFIYTCQLLKSECAKLNIYIFFQERRLSMLVAQGNRCYLRTSIDEIYRFDTWNAHRIIVIDTSI